MPPFLKKFNISTAEISDDFLSFTKILNFSPSFDVRLPFSAVNIFDDFFLVVYREFEFFTPFTVTFTFSQPRPLFESVARGESPPPATAPLGTPLNVGSAPE